MPKNEQEQFYLIENEPNYMYSFNEHKQFFFNIEQDDIVKKDMSMNFSFFHFIFKKCLLQFGLFS